MILVDVVKGKINLRRVLKVQFDSLFVKNTWFPQFDFSCTLVKFFRVLEPYVARNSKPAAENRLP